MIWRLGEMHLGIDGATSLGGWGLGDGVRWIVKGTGCGVCGGRVAARGLFGLLLLWNESIRMGGWDSGVLATSMKRYYTVTVAGRDERRGRGGIKA
jgi:hypothetical protein